MLLNSFISQCAKWCYITLFCCSPFALFSQLSEGELMFIGFNADGGDGMAFVPLIDLPSQTTIYFTDNEWNGSPIGEGGAFNTYEDHCTWVSGNSITPAGSIIFITEINNSNATVNLGSFSGILDITADPEVIYAYQGPTLNTPSIFLSAIANGGFSLPYGTLINTGLTEGINAISISGYEDVMIYDGSTTCDGTVEECATNIADASNWVTEDGTGDQSQNSIVPDFPDDLPGPFGGSALPIELLNFEIHVINQEEVEIIWETGQEINNDYFSIERSVDGMYWEEIGQISGAGNSTDPISYRFLDLNPLEYTSLYRLKQTDYDGRSASFHAVEVLISRPLALKIYPNPTYGHCMLEFKDICQAQIQVFNCFGALIKVPLRKINNHSIELHLSDLPEGIYIVRFIKNGICYTRQIILQK